MRKVFISYKEYNKLYNKINNIIASFYYDYKEASWNT